MPRDLTRGDVDGWVFKRRSDGAKGKTINRELSALRGVFREAQRRGWIEGNPAEEVARQKEGESGFRWLTPEEASKLLAACKSSSPRSRHLYPLVVTALYTGMRRGELLSLRWADVHQSRAEIEVIASKSGHRRTVPLRAEVNTALKAWRRYSRGQFVFARLGTDQPYAKVQRSFQAAVKRAKIGPLRFHDLRHTAGSWMAQAGVDVHDLMRVLGHREIATTMRYAHLIPRTSRRLLSACRA